MSTSTMTAIPATERDGDGPALDPELVALLPAQGDWSERDYLWLTDTTKRLVEWTDGYIEALPMPTKKHQAISGYLYVAWLSLMQRIGGAVYFSPLRLRVGPRKFREPDLLMVRSADDPRAGNRYWEGADLVVEIVSPDDPARDYETKRADYAAAGVLEYWIVDPQTEQILVLSLEDSRYAEHGIFRRGATATSALFSEFTVNVDTVLDAR